MQQSYSKQQQGPYQQQQQPYGNYGNPGQQQQPYANYAFQQPQMYDPSQQQQPYGYGQQQQVIYPGVPQGIPAQQFGGPIYGNSNDNYLMVTGNIQGVQQNLPSNANGSEFPARVRCPSCSRECTTIVENKMGGAVFGWVFLTLCCCFPFCFIPCFIDNCKDKLHKCPHCQTCVGVTTKSMC